MGSVRRTSRTLEFGDFQTPDGLARRVCAVLAARGVAPSAIVEPTCGIGNFLVAALDQFPDAARAIGLEQNADYFRAVVARVAPRADRERIDVRLSNAFGEDWSSLLQTLPQPVLVIGNPPWVTNAQLGVLGSANLPAKLNTQRLTGLSALTGKSNFDISEWILNKLLASLAGLDAVLAMLCKTSVARKVLSKAWKGNVSLARAEIHPIDAAAEFGVSVDSCLLVIATGTEPAAKMCAVFAGLGSQKPKAMMGWTAGGLIADVPLYHRWEHLEGTGPSPWRSGVKHDCSAVMELTKQGAAYRNRLGEFVELEADCLYPMLKSSELAKGDRAKPTRYMLVPQRSLGADTAQIREHSPKTWEYLMRHGKALDDRASSIYRDRPRFSVFGVGEYTFAPWKVAISGFYKQLQFATVGSIEGKPTVLDDTAYFVDCQTQQEAMDLTSRLHSVPAREFLSSMIFWDAKRPITVEILRRLDLGKLAQELARKQ